MSNNAMIAKKLQLEIVQHIVQDLPSHYDSEEVKRMWRLICQDREEGEKKKMTDNDNNNVN